jgi:hypothetical protein
MITLSINLSTILLLTLMTYQDIKYRAITWYAFPLLAVSLFVLNKNLTAFEVIVNIGFVAFNYISATLMISLRHGRLINLLKAHIGPGDILLLVSVAFYFTPLDFFAFYLSSLLLISLGAGVYLKLQKPPHFTVPLAGLQSALLGCLILMSLTIGISFNSISWLNSYLQ